MKTLIGFGQKEAYKRVEQRGDRLAEIKSLMDWEAFRPIVGDMYGNRSERSGRPNIDVVVIVKLLVRYPAMVRALRSRSNSISRLQISSHS
jgi:hypothetical protein